MKLWWAIVGAGQCIFMVGLTLARLVWLIGHEIKVWFKAQGGVK